MRSKRQAAKWEEYKDTSTPEIRRLLNRLEKARPDMAPLKLSGSPKDKVLFCVTPLRNSPRFGCYCLTREWIKAEILRKQRQRRAEWKKQAVRQLGAYI